MKKFLPVLFSLVSFVFALFLAEAFLIVFGPTVDKLLMGFDDFRSKIEVLDELRKKDERAVLAIHPRQLSLSEDFERHTEEPLMPLAGVPDAETILCNEWGKYYLYRSDRYGFNNPGRVWENQSVPLVLVGDSFTQGFCVPEGGSAAEQLRSEYPDLINLGMSGNGPLGELATMLEYLSDKELKTVAWLYYEGNDIDDLTRELEDPVIGQYFSEAGFRQNLAERRSEVSQVLERYLKEKEKEKRATDTLLTRWLGPKQDQVRKLGELRTLYNLRARLGLINESGEWFLQHFSPSVSEQQVKRAFREVMERAKRFTEERGGELVFLYLPSAYYVQHFGAAPEHPYKPFILETVGSLGIPTKDLTNRFLNHPETGELFPAAADFHYSREGYRIVREAVMELAPRPSQKRARWQSKFPQTLDYEYTLRY